VEIVMPGPRGEESLGLTRVEGEAPEVRIETCSACRCALPRLVHAPELDEAGRVSAALESSREDPPYRLARPHLLWLLGLECAVRQAVETPRPAC
jgi:hypothetical protein